MSNLPNRICLAAVVCLLWLIAACADGVFPYARQLPSPLGLPASLQPFPKIIYHPQPNLPLINTQPFSDTRRMSEFATEEEKAWRAAGYDCLIDTSQWHWNMKREGCGWTVLMKQTECEEIVSPDPLWGGLEPSYPLAQCWVESVEDLQKPGYFYQFGGMRRLLQRYVILRDGQVEEIATRQELQAIYAPITSANEALSYALVATGLTADFRRSFEGERQDYQFFVTEFENTHVKASDEGFQVLLFRTPLPCFTAYVDTVLVTVTHDGQISRSGPKKVYEQSNTFCAD